MTDRVLTLSVFIDAFGWELACRHRFLDDVLVYKRRLDSTFGYSSSCDPTILTGVPPREHGHFSFFYYAPERSPFAGFRALSALPRSVTDRGRVRHAISRAAGSLLGFTGYFQLYAVPFSLLRFLDYSERRDLYKPGGIRGGQPTIFDRLDQAAVPYHCSDWRKGERANLSSLAAEIRTGRIEFAYLFLGQLDAVLHEHGTQAGEVADKLAWYEREIRALLAAAAPRYRDVRLMVFSDHGMTDITDYCDLIARIDALGLRFGRDYAAVYDSTMARFWFLRPGVRERIVEALEGEARGRIVTAEELAAWGCDFTGAEYGELFFLMEPGVLIHPSFMGRKAPRGMHGYAPEHAGTTATFASNWIPLDEPTSLESLCPLMLDTAIGRGGSSVRRGAA